MSTQNLVPNGSFEHGLSEWEATPGVTLIKTEAKRFVMLQAGTRSAALCSDPIPVLPGAAYAVEVERALRGDCEIAVISPSTLLRPDHAGEVIPVEDKVRVQITAKPGSKVGIAKVLLVPVGERLEIENLRSTAGFRRSGDNFEILCEVRNTGSRVVAGAMARLITDQHMLAEEHRSEQPVAAIEVGGVRRLSWPVAKQRIAYAPFEVEVEYAGGLERAKAATLRHVPRPPDVKPAAGAASGRRWYSVSSRALRLTAHDTDLDYGPGLLTTAAGTELGVIEAPIRLLLPGGSSLPLWSKLKQVTAAGVELGGRNEWLEWSLLLRTDVQSRGIGLEWKAMGRKRLAGVRVEALPFHTESAMVVEGGAVAIDAPKERTRLRWSAAMPRNEFAFFAFPESGMASMRSEPFVLSPGLTRVTASIAPAVGSLAR